MKRIFAFIALVSVVYFWGFTSVKSQNTCATALDIPVENYSTCGLMAFQNVNLTSASASSQAPNPTCGNFSGTTKDQWFTFTVPADITTMAFHAFNSDYQPILFGNSEPALAVYRGTDCSSLALLACFESAGSFGNNGEVRWEPISGLIPGETLYVRIWDKDNQSQHLFFAASVRLDMQEDDCNSPMTLGTGGCNILSTGGDIDAPDDCGWSSTDNSIFFHFTVTADDPQPYELSVQNGECWNNGGADDPQIQFAVYSWNGSNCSGIGGSGSSYQGCASGDGTVTFTNTLTPGEYILAMDGYSTSAGNSLCLFGFEAPFIEQGDILAEISTTNESCGELGTATVSVNQSCTGNPTITWSTGATGTSIANLTAGTYSVTITDGVDCDTVIESFDITSVNNFSVEAFSIGDPCDESISLTAEVTGATPGQCTFIWNTTPAQTAQNAQVTEPGTYTVTATFGSCTDVDDATVTMHDHIFVTNFNDHNCINSNSQYEVSFNVNYVGGGAADFFVNTGSGNVQYSGSFTTVYPSATQYAITVTDLNDCDIFTYNGLTDCGCTTFAGTMNNLVPITLCEEECTDMIAHNDDQYLEGDDLFMFVVHSGEYPAIPLAQSTSPEFCFSQLNGGEYGVTYYVSAIAGEDLGGVVNTSDPCYSQSAGVPVVWFQNPLAYISATELTVCGLEITLNASEPQYGMTGSWGSTGSFVPVGLTSTHTHIMNVLAADYGDMTFTWSLTNGICSGSDQVLVHFLPAPVAFAGDDFAICGNQASLQATQSVSGSSCQWTGSGSFTSASTFDTDVTGATYGTLTFTVRESVGNCWDEDRINVTFVEQPNPTTVASYDTVCGVNGSIEVLNVIGEGTWAAWFEGSLLVPAPFYDPGLNSPSTDVTIGNFPIGQHTRTVEFIWTETNTVSGQSCTATASTLLTFSEEPIASVPDDEAEICGNTYQLSASVTGSEWATGMWISPQVPNPFDDPTLPNATATIPVPGSFGDSAYVAVPFLWAVTNTGCTSLDTMLVTFYRQPVANAGLDREVCGNNSILGAVYSLPESNNYSPNGSWSVYSRPEVSALADISPQTGDTVDVTVSHVGVWEFVFRENNTYLTSCKSTDTVQITFIEVPVISAGEDTDVCGQVFTLEAITGGANGTWLPNGTSITEFSNPNSLTTSPSYGAINYVWLESNEFCSAIDTVVITFWRQPQADILTDNADSTVCGLTFNNLRAESPGTGITGYWYNINPSTVYGDVFSNDTWATVPSYGYHDFYWIEETGPELEPGFCNDTAGPLTIHFLEIPTANGGADTLFCGRSGYLNANPSLGTGVWSTPSTSLVLIENQNDPESYIESAITNTGNPTYPFFNLVWTEDNSNGCTDSDTIKVVFARVPSSEMNIIPPKCFGEPATIAAAEDTLQQYTWNFYAGIVDSTTNNLVDGAYQNFVYWRSIDTLHRISLISTNYWGCQSAINVDTIYEPAIPNFDVTLVQDTCLLGRGGIVFNDTSVTNAFFWTDTTVGPVAGTSITAVYNLPVGEYGIRTSYLTPNVTHYAYYLQTFGSPYCVDTFYYEVEPVGLIEAEISLSADVILSELIAPNALVTFVNSSNYDDVSKRCEWNFGDGTKVKSCDEYIEHIYTEADCYIPFLVVMNRDLPECRDTAWLEECIRVDNQSKIEVPNVFSPNGDGINDYFQVKAQSLRTFSGVITNRWGRVVYEWTDWETYESGWDGLLNGGSRATPGVYFFVIKAEGLDNYPYESYGAFHLMRE